VSGAADVRTAPAGEVDAALGALPEREQVAIVEEWIRGSDAARVAAIAAGERAHKSARKAAKKGVHVLKARGVTIEEPVRSAGPAAPAVGPAASSESRGYLTKVDPAGVQILLHVHAARGGGLQGAQAIVQRGVGIVDGGAVQLSRKELRTHMDRLIEDGVRLFTVSADHVRARIGAVVERARDAAKPVPESLLAVEIHLPPAQPVNVHPIEDKLPRAERRTGRVAEVELEALEHDVLLASWGPEEDEIHALIERMKAAGGGGVLVLSDAQKAEAAEEALGKTVDEGFGDRAAWAADLRDTAYCFASEGDVALAELLARSADELDDLQRPTRDVAFARWLFRHHVAAHAEHHHHGGEPHDEDGGDEPKRSPGGLYIP